MANFKVQTNDSTECNAAACGKPATWNVWQIFKMPSREQNWEMQIPYCDDDIDYFFNKLGEKWHVRKERRQA